MALSKAVSLLGATGAVLSLLVGPAVHAQITIGAGQSATNATALNTGTGAAVTFTGDNATFTNAAGAVLQSRGRLFTSSPSVGEAVTNSNVTINNSGTIQQDDGGSNSGFYFINGSGIAINNLSGGVIRSLQTGSNHDGRPISFESNVTGATLTNAGLITSTGASDTGAAINIGPGSANVTISNQATGSITQTGSGAGILVSNDSNLSPSNVTISNAGTISGSASKPAINFAKSVFASTSPSIAGSSITSSGTIDGSASGVAIDNSANTAALTIASGGSIRGAVKFGTAADTLSLSGGSLAGNVVGQGAGTLAFTGTSGSAFAIAGSVTGVQTIALNGVAASLAGSLSVGSTGRITTTLTGDGTLTGAGSDALGRLSISGSVTIASGATVTPDITQFSNISDGARYVLAVGTQPASVGTVTATSTGAFSWQVLAGNDASLGQSANAVYLVAHAQYAGNPQTGWWFNSSEGGRGFSLEVNGSQIFLSTYLYAADGTPLWYVALAPKQGPATFQGPLQQFANGQTVSGSYVLPNLASTVGTATLSFSSATTGVLTWPGAVTPIQRYDFVSGGVAAGPATGMPQTGWWWNASEGGRGFFLEVQGSTMFLSGYMYDSRGQAVWYVALGTMSSTTLFQGSLAEYRGGQTLGGAYQAPAFFTSPGSVTVQFDSPAAATMTLPGGIRIPLVRYTF